MGRHSDEVRGLTHSLEQRTAEVDEMQRALHRLPKPAEHIGDGPDERVRLVLSLLDSRAKQIDSQRGVIAQLQGELAAATELLGKGRADERDRVAEMLDEKADSLRKEIESLVGFDPEKRLAAANRSQAYEFAAQSVRAMPDDDSA